MKSLCMEGVLEMVKHIDLELRELAVRANLMGKIRQVMDSDGAVDIGKLQEVSQEDREVEETVAQRIVAMKADPELLEEFLRPLRV